MPVTKTAKRALRGSRRKESLNKIITSSLEFSLRVAKKSKKDSDVKRAISLTDRAVKKKVIHKNKAARIKAQLSKLVSGQVVSSVKKSSLKKSK